MKITNKTKDYIKLIVIFVIIMWVITGAIYYVKSLFAIEITPEQRYQTMWEYTENMSEQEYQNTFFAEDINNG